MKPHRQMDIDPVGLHVPVEASYSSAVAVALRRPSCPPATKTFPDGRRTAWAWIRATAMAPVGTQRPLLGRYSSAVAEAPSRVFPPATRTLPSGRRVAVWFSRAASILPVARQLPVGGSYRSA